MRRVRLSVVDGVSGAIKRYTAGLLFAALSLGCQPDASAPSQEPSQDRCACTADELREVSPDTLAADVHLVDGIAPRPDASRPLHVHVVVEIPAGTQAKWEVTKTGGVLAWERTDGGRRVIRYLPYPANYGLVPQTLSPRSDGGDGDPLDVVVLGTALPRGSVVTARVIGVLRLLDEGERDDKLIAVPIAPEDAAFSPLPDVEALRAQRPGALTILETWFSNYDGPGVTTSGGVDGADAARSILDIGIDAYSTSR